MNGLRSYVLSIVSGCILCGIMLSLIQKERLRDLVKLLCGVYMTILVIYPLSGKTVSLDISSYLSKLPNSEPYIQQGKIMAREAMSNIIKEQTRTYILDKATDLRADVSVTVTLSEDDIPVPTAVEFRGKISPYARTQLETILSEDLGIPKEHLQWNGSYEKKTS